jgi:acyl carrier protein
MTTNEIAAAIHHFLLNNLTRPPAADELTANFPLLTSGLLDSLTLFKLLLYLEEKFQVSVQPEEIVAEHFATPAAIEQLVRSRVAG